MSVESCFLTICNDLEWGFWSKKSHFWVFLGGEGNKMALGVLTDGFCTKTVKSHSVS
jgi:hypothetical protein